MDYQDRDGGEYGRLVVPSRIADEIGKIVGAGGVILSFSYELPSPIKGKILMGARYLLEEERDWRVE